ncbi:MAG: M23 family metallopeptidase [Proteobacteria bacterium]|nr:M23 family metallopeptidase [Pseudomonadota bacterium]
MYSSLRGALQGRRSNPEFPSRGGRSGLRRFARNDGVGPIIAALLLTLAVLSPAHAVELRGSMIEGGMMVGMAPAGSTVALDGEAVATTSDGLFVIGFHRDAPETQALEITHPDGSVDLQTLVIEQRSYNIQRIDGLPPSKVTPPKARLERIARERAMVAAARENKSTDTYWADGFTWPARGRVSGVYGSQRVLNGTPKQPHYGLDVAAPKGTPVYAPAGGTVVLAEPDFYYEGGIVIIDHGYGLMSTLFHMQTVTAKVGTHIQQSDPIGTIGATGRATGPHVDWRINWHKARLDPELLVPPMPGEE